MSYPHRAVPDHGHLELGDELMTRGVRRRRPRPTARLAGALRDGGKEPVDLIVKNQLPVHSRTYPGGNAARRPSGRHELG